ncbi:MAG: SsrA-binding protein SmpB [Bacteroidales bacterium]|nr:SsrA-binding protein SmpB [Bacteroidales bacterium]
MRKDTSNIVIRNRRASFEFEFIEKYIAGVQLRGTEIKALRQGKANLNDSYCQFYRGELFVKGLNIAEYSWGNLNNHDPARERKLLLTVRELRKLERKVRETGLTIVVLKIFINDRGLAKLEIALAKGKKAYDKREDLRQKDARREMDRASKK